MTTTAPTAVVPPAEPKPTPPLAPRAPDYRRELELIRTEFLRRVSAGSTSWPTASTSTRIASTITSGRSIRCPRASASSAPRCTRCSPTCTGWPMLPPPRRSASSVRRSCWPQGRTLATQTSAIATIAETTKATLDFLQQKVTL